MEEIQKVDVKNEKYTKSFKYFLIAIVSVSIIVLVVLGVVYGRERDITQMEFESLDEERLTFTIFLGLGKDYTGKILVKENNFDENTVEIICDNPKVIDVSIIEKGNGFLKYKVTSKHNGEAIIYAQTKDGKVKTSNKKITVWGGSDPEYTDEEISIISIKKGMGLTQQQANEVYATMKHVGLNRFESVTYVNDENGCRYYICTTKDLAIDVLLHDTAVYSIKVVDNDDELVLYDDTKGGYIKTISEEEYQEYKNKQANTAKKLTREYVASLIVINSVIKKGPDSEGWVGVKIEVTNKSEKTIKYIYLAFSAFNAVGDQVCCKITGSPGKEVRLVGPIKNGGTKSGATEYYWYNSSIKSIGFSQFDIEYTDGTTISFGNAEIKGLIDNYNNGVR